MSKELKWVYSETLIDGNYFHLEIDKWVSKIDDKMEGVCWPFNRGEPREKLIKNYKYSGFLGIGKVYGEYLSARVHLLNKYDNFTDDKIKFYRYSYVAGPLAATFGVMAKYDGEEFWNIQTGVS
jgi:hypothetical protein